MQRFYVKIKFIKDYLQARMSGEKKANISKAVKKSGVEAPILANDPEEFVYRDKEGCYIPAEQVVGALINSGKDFKIKAKRGSYKEYIKAKFDVEPKKIYMGKSTWDDTLPSTVKKKDGSRLPIVHPVFKKGLEVDFTIEIDDRTGLIDEETVHNLIINAGDNYGLGGRHPRWGRFQVLKFNKID